MSKDKVQKAVDETNERIEKVMEDVEQNNEQIRQHVQGLEQALKEGSLGMSDGASPTRSRSVPKNRGRHGSNEGHTKKKFIADSFTKDLKTGRLPFRHQGDRIARYGKGFSNLLHMAGAPGQELPLSNSMSQNNDYSQMVIIQKKEQILPLCVINF